MRVYDAEDIAVAMRETFADRPAEYQEELRHDWPPLLQNVGDSLAVAYSSDKWKPKGAGGRRETEPYKHLAESRNQALVLPGLLRDYYAPNREVDVRGPLVAFEEVPMPRHFAILGLFEECNLQLYTGGSAPRPRFSDDADEGIVKVTVRHGMLGASKIRWSEVDPEQADQPFLFVYTPEGVLIIIVGERLDIAKDGIVG